MTYFSFTPLVFLAPFVWDGAAHVVRKIVAVLESGRSAARPDSGTSATVEADGLRTTAEHVPDFWETA